MTTNQKTAIDNEGSTERSWIPATYTLQFDEDGKGNFPAGSKGDQIGVLLRKCHMNPQRRVNGRSVCDLLLPCGVIAEVYRRYVRVAE